VEAVLGGPFIAEPHPPYKIRPAYEVAPGAGLPRRLWAYQRERFPLLANALLVAAIGFSALSFSALLRGSGQLPQLGSVLVGCSSAFLFFLEMRIADEYKDAADDARFRPYRPVPRGVVTLRQLGAVGAAAAVLQSLFALLLDPALLPLLVVVWVYLGLMTREFFARRWLRSHLVAYMATHMPILPLIFFYATACDWRLHAAFPPAGLAWLLAVVVFSGVLLEVGRKIRAPQDEEDGVETYSVIWGRSYAVMVWYAALLGVALTALGAASQIRLVAPVALVLATLLALAAAVAIGFLRSPKAGAGDRIDKLSGGVVALVFLCLGTLPLVLRA
jgi:4-hydroxybenzoate polyprenyltransferase